MKISIAMATYNGAKFLQEQLDSFLNQCRQPDELVVYDDSSTDATLRVLEAFRQRAPFAMHIYRNEMNLGYTRNFEKAMSLCNGDLIFLSDQDDVWHPQKISTVLGYFINNPGAELVINDANYADEKLNHFGVTVIQKVKNIGSTKNDHIAGACTALTRRFRDFVLPFPKDNCPAHDVYLHRWANLIGTKFVIEAPLQDWRIHGSNSTYANEMSDPRILSPFSRYIQTKNQDATSSYLKKAAEFRAMIQVLEERSESLSLLPMARPVNIVHLMINRTIAANESRSKLMGSGWFEKKYLIIQMIIRGQYQHFKGLKSIAKDLLR